MGGGKGENSGPQHEAPEHSAVDVHRGEYQQVRDPDDSRAADMDLALVMFRSLTVITAVSAIMCAVVNFVSLLRTFRWQIDTYVGMLRIYAVIFASFIAVAETEWEWLFRQWPYLQYWFGRGMLQIFVAVMTKALSLDSWSRSERVMHNVSAWMLFGCGVIYSLAVILCTSHAFISLYIRNGPQGIFCMRKLKRRRIQKKQWREQAVKDLEDLEKKRRDLQGLLAEGS